jgi:hypothetical protein
MTASGPPMYLAVSSSRTVSAFEARDLAAHRSPSGH